ncbi:MAG: MopE-related protein [Myxococcota bacterium]
MRPMLSALLLLGACTLDTTPPPASPSWEAPEAPLAALFDAELLPGDTQRPPATPGFHISPGEVVLSGPGQPSTMTIAVTGANPSSVVRVGYAFGGMQPGPCYAIFGGACFDIGPVILPLPGVVLTDASGNGTLVVTVPSTAPGGYIAFQALDLPYGSTSNAVARGIFPAGTVVTPSLDMDGDGYAIDDGDCVDSDPLISPVMFDYVGDGVDRNCDDVDGFDLDGDGYAAIYSGGDDCNDINALVNPGADGDSDGLNACDDCDDTNALVGSTAADLVGDGLDTNCDGLDGVDGDGDGIASVESGGLDCGDDDAAVLPGAPDVVGDDIDNNCDGIDGVDGDGDGVANEASGGTDCDDTTALVFPGAADTVGNDLDENCDDLDGIDDDRDSFASTASGGLDCDDTSKDTNPAAPDAVGDGVDTNCDDLDGTDGDGDGVASTDSGGLDCDDTTALISPERDEVCGDAVDDNCDGVSACPFAENSWPTADDGDIPADFLDGSELTGFFEGQRLPNIQFVDQYGDTVELYQFYGDFVLINLARWDASYGQSVAFPYDNQALHDANVPDLVMMTALFEPAMVYVDTYERHIPRSVADLQVFESMYLTNHLLVHDTSPTEWPPFEYDRYVLVGPDLRVIDDNLASPAAADVQDAMANYAGPAFIPLLIDNDGDGFASVSSGGLDCDDTVAAITPYTNVDGDVFTVCDDCDDLNPDVYLGAPVTGPALIDWDCDQVWESNFVDADGDGWVTWQYGSFFDFRDALESAGIEETAIASFDCDDAYFDINLGSVFGGTPTGPNSITPCELLVDVLSPTGCIEGAELDCDGQCQFSFLRGNYGCNNGDSIVHINGSNGYYNFFSYANFDCAFANHDDGECPIPNDTGGGLDTSTPTCPAGEELDCDGNCQPSNYIGDGFCDDGVNYPSNFNCAQFNFDDGDCAP